MSLRQNNGAAGAAGAAAAAAGDPARRPTMAESIDFMQLVTLFEVPQTASRKQRLQALVDQWRQHAPAGVSIFSYTLPLVVTLYSRGATGVVFPNHAALAA